MTNNEAKNLAEIRNLLTPVLNYFKMKEKMDEYKEESIYLEVVKLLNREYNKSQENIKKVKEILDSFN